jgi:hypothetical protein
MAKSAIFAAAVVALGLGFSVNSASASWREADGSGGKASCWVIPGASDKMSLFNSSFVVCRGANSASGKTRSGYHIEMLKRETATHLETVGGYRCPKSSRSCS